MGTSEKCGAPSYVSLYLIGINGLHSSSATVGCGMLGCRSSDFHALSFN